MGDSGKIVRFIFEHFRGTRGQLSGVEVGVHRGETSEALLRTFPRLFLMMVDPWDTYQADHPYRKSGDGCAKLSAKEQAANRVTAEKRTLFAESRRKVVVSTSVAAAKSLAGLLDRRGENSDGRFDFVFIDGDHTFDAVRADIAAWWPLVNDGGLLCGHDIDHPRDVRGVWGVRRAVEEHANAVGLTFQVAGNCWWMVKTPTARDVLQPIQFERITLRPTDYLLVNVQEGLTLRPDELQQLVASVERTFGVDPRKVAVCQGGVRIKVVGAGEFKAIK